MKVTIELRAKLRKWLNEKIPSGGSDTDTRFTDTDIDELIIDADTLDGAASQGWLEKAGMVAEELGAITETATGDERYKYRSLKEQHNYCLKMKEEYAAKENSNENEDTLPSLMLTLQRPNVMP